MSNAALPLIHPLDDPRLDWNLLHRYDFDEQRFRHTASAVACRNLSAEDSVLRSRITPTDEIVTATWTDPEARRVRELGSAALAAGRVAVVVLNGGMATRFGGAVKGVVEALDGASFLALKAEDVRRASEDFGAPIPLALMNSFATDAKTKEHLQQHRRFGLDASQLTTFTQSIVPRLHTDGSLFVGPDGRPSYCAPGHGDFFRSLRVSGLLARWLEHGIEQVLFSNVDNLAATIDPVIIGHHLASRSEMTVEVTQKQRTPSGAWDKGGAPAKVDGRPQIVEGFRFPKTFVQERLPYFSTNNMVFDARALDREVPLPRHVVHKQVAGRTAVQLETITCEASALDDSHGKPLFDLCLLRVPRSGSYGRFLPVKNREDLARLRPQLAARLAEGWQLRALGR
jgi:UTP--glucose-1-phosphate uridylyltransferase